MSIHSALIFASELTEAIKGESSFPFPFSLMNFKCKELSLVRRLSSFEWRIFCSQISLDFSRHFWRSTGTVSTTFNLELRGFGLA